MAQLYYRSAILKAIRELKDRCGSDGAEIKKFVKEQQARALFISGEREWQETAFQKALRDMVTAGELEHVGTRFHLPGGENQDDKPTFKPVRILSKNTLCDMVAEMWRNGQLVDAEIISSDGQSFQAHRLVLASNSDFMKALLVEDRFMESSNGKIELRAVSSSAFTQILEWMYGSGCEICTLLEAIELIEAASLLQCKPLLDQLEDILCKSVDATSCLTLWSLGERLSLDQLPKTAKEVSLMEFRSLTTSDEFLDNCTG